MVVTMCASRSGLLWTILSVFLLPLLAGCSGPAVDDQENSQLEDAQAEVARLETDISRLEDKERQSQVEQLKKQNGHDKETSDNQLKLSLLEQENEQLRRETTALQDRVDKVTRDLVSARSPNPPRGPTGTPPPVGGPKDTQANLPPEIKEDGSECKDCATPFVGRLAKCVDGNCRLGFITLSVRNSTTGSKKPVKFPCPSCMGLGRMPCVTCRKADHGFVLVQHKHVGLLIRKDKSAWIKAVGQLRQAAAARSSLARAKTSSERSRASSRLASAEAQLTRINEQRLEIAYAIGEIYNRAFTASLRNIPTSEHAALKRKGSKTIDRFNELFIRGFYH